MIFFNKVEKLMIENVITSHINIEEKKYMYPHMHPS